MDQLGINKDYFKNLQFFNEKQSVVYVATFVLVFVLTGGLIPFLKASIGGLLIAIILHRALLNKRQPVPTSSSVIITGCSSGIGELAAQHLLKQGLVVFATVRKQSDADLLKKSCNNNNKLVTVLLDVTKNETIGAAAQQIEGELKSRKLSLLGLVNNAGFAQTGMLEHITNEAQQYQFNVNVFGLINTTNAFLPLLRNFSPQALKQDTKLRPKVINVSSVMGKFTTATCGLYAASKHTVEGINDAYRQELTRMGIDVVCVQPGLIKSSFHKTVEANVLPNISTDDAVKQYYAHAYEKAKEATDNSSSGAQSPQLVVDIFHDVLLSPNPLPRYSAGVDSNLFTTVFPILWPGLLDGLSFGMFKPIEEFRSRATKPAVTVAPVVDKTEPVVVVDDKKQD